MNQAQVDQLSSTVYAETKSFYESIASSCGDLGFKILYGPPHINPPILFLGFQPGGGVEDCMREVRDGAHDHWPAVSEYATQDWKLAYWMRRMFGAEMLSTCVGLNATCVGLNALFMRAPDVDVYKKAVPALVRGAISVFCLPRVQQLIEAIDPRVIVTIGFDTLALFCESSPDLISAKGRTLTKLGKVGSRPAIAAMHLSGAQISAQDRMSIRDRILAM